MSRKDPLVPQAFSVALLRLSVPLTEELQHLRRQVGKAVETNGTSLEQEIYDYLERDPDFKQHFEEVYDSLEKQARSYERTKSATIRGSGAEALSWEYMVVPILIADDLYTAARNTLKKARSQFSRLSSTTQMFLSLLQKAITAREAQATAILKTLDKRPLTIQDLVYVIGMPLEQTKALVQSLWNEGYLDRTTSGFMYMIFPMLQLERRQGREIDENTYLTLTSKGYFFLHPVITSSKSGDLIQ